MNRYFKCTQEYNSDLYIVDYTEQTKNTDHKRGVEFHIQAPLDIKGLKIKNQNKQTFFAVNFEDNTLKNDEGLTIRQCECLCSAKKERGIIVRGTNKIEIMNATRLKV